MPSGLAIEFVTPPDWSTRATPVADVRIDIAFIISEAFYFGPENNFTPEQWMQFREPLYAPQLPRHGTYLLSSEITGAKPVAELVRYYQSVLARMAHHHKDPSLQPYYFWLRPLIYVVEPGVRPDPGMDEMPASIGFPWYDTWDESTRLLDALAAPGDKNGMLFDNVEQGWDFQAFAQAGQLFLRAGDSDSGEEHLVLVTDRTAFARQIPPLQDCVTRLLLDLSKILGQNYWTRHKKESSSL